jgi:hypothetical protein
VGGRAAERVVFVQLHREIRAMPMRETAARDGELCSFFLCVQQTPLLELCWQSIM